MRELRKQRFKKPAEHQPHQRVRRNAAPASLAVAAAAVLLMSSCAQPPGDPTVGASGGKPGGNPSPSPSATGPDPTSTADGLPAVPVFDPAPKPFRAKPTGKGAKGATPLFSDIETDQKVAFITIDDGAFKEPKAAQLFQKANVPVTLFLQGSEVDPNPAYFKKLQAAGADIQDHTQTHAELPGLSESTQRKEICDTADKFQKMFGKRPTMFRPPYGSYDDTTKQVAASCGFKSIALWRETTDKGKLFYQDGDTIKPGDIVLMHFRPAFIKDYVAVLKAMKKSGVTPARLSDYIG